MGDFEGGQPKKKNLQVYLLQRILSELLIQIWSFSIIVLIVYLLVDL